MCSMRWFLLKSCIFGVFISVTEAHVSLKTSDGKTTYLIDSTVELVCTIAPYNYVMTWYVNNVPYADCFLRTCGPSPNKPYTFRYTFNETAGVFNLTINSVKSSHANLSFVCDDGTQNGTISFNVTTDNGTTSNTSNTPTKPDINNQITATSENNNDNSLSRGTKIGLGVGLGVGIPTLICGIACGIALYMHRKTIAEIRAILPVWIEVEGNCCILMKGLLEIEELPRIMMIETKNVLSSIPMNDAIRTNIITRLNEERDEITNRLRRMEEQDDAWKLRQEARIDVINEEHKLMTIQELVPNESFANSIMLDLAQYETFSSFIVKKFAKREVFNLIISKLQKNTDVYKKIKIGIEKAKEDHTQMNGGD